MLSQRLRFSANDGYPLASDFLTQDLTMPNDLVVSSLEVAAERGGDIAPAVYAAYFKRCPESADVMRLVDVYMRGRMLDSVLQLVLADDIAEQVGYLRYETRNHLSYGALPHMYESLLLGLQDTVQALLGSDWTATMAAAWDTRLSEILREIRASLGEAA